VLDVKTEEIGPGEYRFKAEIDFKGGVVVDSYLNRRGRHRLYTALRAAAASADDRALDTVMIEYGARPGSQESNSLKSPQSSCRAALRASPESLTVRMVYGARVVCRPVRALWRVGLTLKASHAAQGRRLWRRWVMKWIGWRGTFA
jgi:hypothetical protein